MKDIHDRLDAAGEQWRRAQPRPTAFDSGALDQRPARPWLAVAAAAAAVGVIAVGLWAFAQGQRPAGPLTTDHPSVSVSGWNGVVPWADIPAQHVPLPQVTVPASPDPALAQGLPACSAGDLRLGHPVPDGAAGSMVLTIPVTLAGDHPCRLGGAPAVTLLDHGTPLIGSQAGPGVKGGWQDPVAVTASRGAVLAIWWSPQHSSRTADNDQVRITLADGSTLLTQGFGTTSGSAGEPALAPLSVFAFAPAGDHHPATTTSGYAGVRVQTQPLDLTGPAGSTVRFTVTLTSPTDVVFEECPDFTMTLAGPGVAQVLNHQLNCTAMPPRDPSGKYAMLPANTPMRFQMQVTVPDRPVTKFLWELHAGAPAQQTIAGSVMPSGLQSATAAPDTPSCSASDLKITGRRTGAAMGTAYITVTVRNAGATCALPAAAPVALYAHGRPLPVGHIWEGSPTGHVELRAGASARVQIGWPVSHACASVENDEVRLGFDDASHLSTPGFGQTTCNPGEADYPSVDVTGWTVVP